LPVGRTQISGSPYLGVYLKAGDGGVVVPPSTPNAARREIERLLGVSAVRTTIASSEIVGALVVFNSHGVIVSEEADDDEIAQLGHLGPVLQLRSRQNAIGNNILANDHGAVVHPEFSDDAVARIGRALKVPAHRGTVAGLGTVGMAGIATNKGVVIHPRATPGEAEHIGEVLQVPVHRSTANFGVPIVGACLVANSRAFITGLPTTPVEISHLQEGLSIFD
jgi:translation initiation factor 6